MKRLFVTCLALATFATTLAAQNPNRMRFQASVSPTNLEPPLRNTDANGDCEVAINLVRNQNGDPVQGFVDFGCNLGFGMNQQINGMSIHQGVRGQNGPMVIGANFGNPVMAGPGPLRLFRQIEIVDGPGLQLLERILANPDGFYLVIPSAENVMGVCRDQLRLHDADRLALMERQMNQLRDTTDIINNRTGRLMQRNGLRP